MPAQNAQLQNAPKIRRLNGRYRHPSPPPARHGSRFELSPPALVVSPQTRAPFGRAPLPWPSPLLRFLLLRRSRSPVLHLYSLVFLASSFLLSTFAPRLHVPTHDRRRRLPGSLCRRDYAAADRSAKTACDKSRVPASRN